MWRQGFIWRLINAILPLALGGPTEPDLRERLLAGPEPPAGRRVLERRSTIIAFILRAQESFSALFPGMSIDLDPNSTDSLKAANNMTVVDSRSHFGKVAMLLETSISFTGI